MNLRQQFFWKILIGLSFLLIIIFSYKSYSKYYEYNKYIEEYEKELEVKENKDMQKKADYISQKQDSRINLDINVNSIIEKTITNHGRAGIKTSSKSGWGSNEPVYKGMVGNYALIDYRESKGKRYKINNKIEGSDMLISSFTGDKVIIKYPNGDLRAFYLESYEQIKK